MSNFDERNTRSAEGPTLAGIAAIIVVAVFVVCVILVLAKSLFPSNDSKVKDDVYTGTKPSSSSVADSLPTVDDSSQGGAIIDESSVSDTDSTFDSLAESGADTSSVVLGETAYLTQTAYLRSADDENAEPILSISAGEEVIIIDRPAGSEYVHINYIGYDGYVWYGYLG